MLKISLKVFYQSSLINGRGETAKWCKTQVHVRLESRVVSSNPDPPAPPTPRENWEKLDKYQKGWD